MADSNVQSIKEKLSIIDVVAPYVKLTKAGKYMRGLSPFAKEKTPSFFVNVDRGSYYCFSTSQGGDIFTFVEKMEGVDFRGAMKLLAEKAGIELTNERGVDHGRTERLRDAMSQAVQFFERGLSKDSAAYTYALSRGLTSETITSWALGYAPDSWRGLLEELNGKGFSNAELISAGLIKEADGRKGTWYDRFRNRLMFPIRDAAGRTVAFTGRALDPNDQAKYLNSPETELFKKHEVLFGMDRAKDSIRTRGFAILVEGQFDLLLLHQVGFQNTIALSGTALSSQHLSLIKRYADNLMLCLDADTAGLAASAKNAETALRAGMRVKAVRLPSGKDPADLAHEDPKDFAKRVGEAQSIVEFFLSVLTSSEKDSHRLVLAAERTVVPLLSAIQSPLEREHFVGVMARTLGLSADSVRASLAKTTSPSFVSKKTPLAPVVSSEKIGSTVARRGEFLLAVAANYPDTELAEMLKNEYSRIIGASVPEEPIPERVLFEAGLSFGEPPTESAISDLVSMLERAVLAERLKDATDDLRRAELAGDATAIATLITTCKDLSSRLAVFS
ncbi:DNA primase [Patescibacteria group bacterium]|nr:DNA primase [Patescibacteria group bacterium]